MKKYALIVAGGKGLRMGSELPKQFLSIGRIPVLMRTLQTFYSYDSAVSIILVLPHSQQEYWRQLCEKHHFTIPHVVVDGGETRFHSVRNGLSQVTKEGYIAVHDGVRPFVAQQVIARCYELVAEKKAVIPVVDVVDTIRHLEEAHSVTVSRDEYKLVQTPQVFSSDLLIQAYQQPYKAQFTDDASVVEAMGVSVHLTAGNRENIKITTPFDLQVASALLTSCSI